MAGCIAIRTGRLAAFLLVLAGPASAAIGEGEEAPGWTSAECTMEHICTAPDACTRIPALGSVLLLRDGPTTRLGRSRDTAEEIAVYPDNAAMERALADGSLPVGPNGFLVELGPAPRATGADFRMAIYIHNARDGGAPELFPRHFILSCREVTIE